MIASIAANWNSAPVMRLLHTIAIKIWPIVYTKASVKLLPPTSFFMRLNIPILNSVIHFISHSSQVFGLPNPFQDLLQEQQRLLHEEKYPCDQ